MRYLAGALILFVALAGACSDGGGGRDPFGPTTSTSGRPRPTTPIPVDPALPEVTAGRFADRDTEWKLKTFVATDAPGPRYCLTATVIHRGVTGEQASCPIKPHLDAFRGPTVGIVSTFFGAASLDTARVRLYDKARTVVDATPHILGRYPFAGWIAFVPNSYQPELAKAFDIDGRELRSAAVSAA